MVWVSARRAEGSRGEGVDPEQRDFAMENRGNGQAGFMEFGNC